MEKVNPAALDALRPAEKTEGQRELEEARRRRATHAHLRQLASEMAGENRYRRTRFR